MGVPYSFTSGGVTADYVITQINASISAVLGTAGAAFDTLGEIQTAIETNATNIDGKVSKAGDTMTGPLALPAGSVTAPAISFGNLQTGFYNPAAGQVIYYASAGVDRMGFVNGQFRIGSPALSITMGVASAPALAVHGVSNSQSTIGFGRWSADGNSASFVMGKSRSTTVGTFGGALQTSDILGGFTWQGDNGTAFANGAVLRVLTLEPWTAGANGTEVQFQIVAPGTTTLGTVAKLRGGGGLSMGGLADQGANTVHASDYFDDGVNLTAIYARLAAANAFTSPQAIVASGAPVFSVTSTAGGTAQFIADNTPGAFVQFRYQTSAQGVNFSQNKARGTLALPTACLLNDSTFFNISRGYGGSVFVEATRAEGVIIEPTPSDTAMGASYRISVAPLGASGVSEVVRFEHGTGLSMYGANQVIDANRLFRPRPFTFGTLPAASGVPGAECEITDALAAPTYYAAAAGGGTTRADVKSDGTIWRYN